MRIAVAALAVLAACVEETDPVAGDPAPGQQPDAAAEPIADAGAADGPMGLGAAPIRGVKWKNQMHGKDMASSFRFETAGLSYAEAVAGLCEGGIRAVVLKQAEPNIMRWTDPTTGETGPCNGRDDAWCKERIDGEIADMVAAIDGNTSCAEKPLVYLWQRQWFDDAGKVDAYAADMAAVIRRLRDRGLAGRLAGIAAIESNLDGSCQTKNTALAAARAINARTGGWLRSRSFFFPGAGMGAYFRNIHADHGCMSGREFLARIEEEVGTFSFIYKQMAYPYGGCGEDEWQDSVGKGSTLSVDERRAWLADGCLGVADLFRLVDGAAADHPAVANVTFWGDSGDGIHLIPQPTLAALHSLLVAGRSGASRHHFFDMTYVDAAICPSDAACGKSLLTVEGGRAAPNQLPSAVPTPLTVFGDWQGWTADDPGY